jgi:hypothetical protein
MPFLLACAARNSDGDGPETKFVEIAGYPSMGIAIAAAKDYHIINFAGPEDLPEFKTYVAEDGNSAVLEVTGGRGGLAVVAFYKIVGGWSSDGPTVAGCQLPDRVQFLG